MRFDVFNVSDVCELIVVRDVSYVVVVLDVFDVLWCV